MYYLERGLNLKWLGVFFAIATAIAAFGIGNMVQSNSVADARPMPLPAPVINATCPSRRNNPLALSLLFILLTHRFPDSVLGSGRKCRRDCRNFLSESRSLPRGATADMAQGYGYDNDVSHKQFRFLAGCGTGLKFGYSTHRFCKGHYLFQISQKGRQTPRRI